MIIIVTLYHPKEKLTFVTLSDEQSIQTSYLKIISDTLSKYQLLSIFIYPGPFKKNFRKGKYSICNF